MKIPLAVAKFVMDSTPAVQKIGVKDLHIVTAPNPIVQKDDA